jgi:hypothetical protein
MGTGGSVSLLALLAQPRFELHLVELELLLVFATLGAFVELMSMGISLHLN